MGSRFELRDRVVRLLSDQPMLASVKGRQALLYLADLDDALNAKIDVDGATEVFIAKLLQEAEAYGTLRTGEDAVVSVLHAVQNTVGAVERANIDELVGQIQTAPPATLSTATEMFLRSIVDLWLTAESKFFPDDVRLPDIAPVMRVRPIAPDYVPTGPFDTANAPTEGDSLPVSHSAVAARALDAVLRWNAAPSRIVVLGDPGTGKTTLIKQAAAALAQSALEDLNTPLPIPITLPSVFARGGLGGSFIEHVALATPWIEGLGPALRRDARKRGVALLLDGLDEISIDQLGTLRAALEVFVQQHAQTRVAITSRRIGYSGFRGYLDCAIVPLTLSEQRHLLIQLCGVERTRELLREIAGRAVLEEMAGVPLMLNVLAVVARQMDDLSAAAFRRFSFLFKYAARSLLEGRHRGNRGVASAYNAERILAPVSYKLHYEPTVDDAVTTDLLEQTIDECAGDKLKPWGDARRFVNDIADTSNLLFPTTNTRTHFKYLHRTFREMFAAAELASQDIPARNALVEKLLPDTAWSEVLSLLAGFVPDPDAYVQLVAGASVDIGLRALREAGFVSAKTALDVLLLRPSRVDSRPAVFALLLRKLDPRELVDVLRRYLEATGIHIPRLDLYLVRAVLQQLRIDSATELMAESLKYLPRVPEILFDCGSALNANLNYWIAVPGGPCVIGARADDPDRPSWVPEEVRLHISEFSVGRVPITNGIYEAFDPDRRTRRAFAEKVGSADLIHHPVVDVTWYEASLFCEWARTRFSEVRLPTELEWEKAASWDGNSKRRFPWGDQWNSALLNCWETGPNRTTRVGAYPDGASPCGALDMAGNVWEWCENRFERDGVRASSWIVEGSEDPVGPHLFSGRRADRGGGWYDDVGRPCTFLRAADDPGDAFRHCGFRVIMSPRPMSSYGMDIFD